MAELQDKLSLKTGMRVIIMRAPQGYAEQLPILAETKLIARLSGWFDFIQYFATSRQQLAAVIGNLSQHLEPKGMLWVAWPKQGSPLSSPDLTDNTVRQLGHAAGLVDTKVAALDEHWSALKFVRRTAER